ncbi:hypothetical protein [Salmon gill poxvirus]
MDNRTSFRLWTEKVLRDRVDDLRSTSTLIFTSTRNVWTEDMVNTMITQKVQSSMFACIIHPDMVGQDLTIMKHLGAGNGDLTIVGIKSFVNWVEVNAFTNALAEICPGLTKIICMVSVLDWTQCHKPLIEERKHQTKVWVNMRGRKHDDLLGEQFNKGKYDTQGLFARIKTSQSVPDIIKHVMYTLVRGHDTSEEDHKMYCLGVYTGLLDQIKHRHNVRTFEERAWEYNQENPMILYEKKKKNHDKAMKHLIETMRERLLDGKTHTVNKYTHEYCTPEMLGIALSVIGSLSLTDSVHGHVFSYDVWTDKTYIKEFI